MGTELLMRPGVKDAPAPWVIDRKGPRAQARGNESPTQALIDVSAGAVAAMAAMYLRFENPEAINLEQHAAALVMFLCLFALGAYAQGMYRHDRSLSLAQQCVTLVRVVATASIILGAIIFALHALAISRVVMATTPVLTLLLTCGWRVIHHEWLEPSAARAIAGRRVLIIGTGEVGRSFAHHLRSRNDLGYKVQGLLNIEADDGNGQVGALVATLENLARSEFIDEVIVSVPSARELVKTLAVEAGRLHVDIKVIPEMYDGAAWLSPIEFIGEFPVCVLHREPIPQSSLFLKRILDVVIASTGLIAITPLLIIIALLIKLDSRGPIFYCARRLGQKGNPFTCFKFRTMVVHAAGLKSSLQYLNSRRGALFKVKNDPRVTRVGRFLRKYSLDELPQLWNVVRGEMSLVGPRPPEPGEVKQYRSSQLRRLDMTPGITGLWQVSARRDPSFDSAVALDTYYIENWSMWLDFVILAKTAKVVLAGTGE